MAGNIFVSYRRDDSKHAAGRLVDRLHAEFDEGQIFLDVDNIELGLDFNEVINDRVAACNIMLVVIGPSWLAAADATSRQRLEDPNDFVRVEIEAALKRNIRVIPVLVDGAEPPRAQDLPESLAPLAHRQATRLTHETFSSDAERLTAALARMTAKIAPPEPESVAEADSQTEVPLPEPEPSINVEAKTDDPAELAEDVSPEEILPEDLEQRIHDVEKSEDGLGSFLIICPNCEESYRIPSEVIPREGRDVSCPACGLSWFVGLDDSAANGAAGFAAGRTTPPIYDASKSTGSLTDDAASSTQSTPLQLSQNRGAVEKPDTLEKLKDFGIEIAPYAGLIAIGLYVYFRFFN